MKHLEHAPAIVPIPAAKSRRAGHRVHALEAISEESDFPLWHCLRLLGPTGQAAMQFTIYGVKYDTADMQGFPTGDPETPTIYLDQNCRVFVERVEKGAAVVSWSTTAEIKALVSRYKLSELERATRHLPEL
jgi:hypothetical protein